MDSSEAPKRGAQSLTHKKSKKDFLTVGIGASAGGVKALKEFFSKMPPDSGMAFAVVLHLSQTYESNLAAILGRETKMPVIQVTEAVKVEPNHVYVIPPAKGLEMIDGIVRVTQPQRSRGARVTIDRFFRTLADSHGASAVGIVLSGTGEDGTLGLKKIKEENGFAIVQEPTDAEQDQMPRTAMETGLVDWVLPIEQMPEKLLWLRKSSEELRLTEADDDLIASEVSDLNALREILNVLRVRTGHDFSSYKHPTLLRRIARHLQIHELENMQEYVRLLRERPEESEFLLANLLINVTNFFRNPDAFDVLEKDVIPRMFAGKNANDQIRVWVPACATGEEAYSIGMLLCEYASRFDDVPKIQIFATDVDEEAVAFAREGRYGETSCEQDVSPARLRRFFNKEGSSYRVKKSLREMILFATHNILRDPPFSKLDLVSCRNLLIYLNREAQERVMNLFHFALQSNGFLLLGSSESAENQPLLFSPYDKKQRLYLRRPTSPVDQTVLELQGGWQPDRLTTEVTNGKQGRTYSFNELHFRLLEKYAPPSLLVSEDYEIVHLTENVGRYLQFVGGEPTSNLLKVVHPALRADLRAALYTAKQDNITAETRPIRAEIAGEKCFVNVRVQPVEAGDAGGGFMLVIFEESKIAENAPFADSELTSINFGGNQAMEVIVRRLEEELNRTKSRLRLTIEQHETSIEELKASNEELMSINEELRSATEELETSKEELQSVNEELTTVNYELSEKIEEISRGNSDLQNLIHSTDIGTIFLDRSLQIKRFTPSAQEIFNLLPSDAGRRIDDLTNKLDYADLTEDAMRVLRNLRPVEREVKSRKGRYYLARLLPYRSADDKIDGVVLTFLDITEPKQAEKSIRFKAQLLNTVEQSVIATDLSGVVTFWNQFAEKLFGWTAEEALGRNIMELTPFETEIEQAEEIMSQLRRGEKWNGEFWVRRRDGSKFLAQVSNVPITDEQGKLIGVVGVSIDVTEHKQTEAALRHNQEMFSALVNNAPFGVYMIDSEFRLRSVNHGARAVFIGIDPLIGRDFAEILRIVWDEPFATEAIERFRHTLRTGESYYSPTVVEHRGNIDKIESYDWQLHRITLPDETYGVVCYFYDLTEQRQMQHALRESEERFRAIVTQVTAGIAEVDLTGKFNFVNDRYVEIVGYLRAELLGGMRMQDITHPDDLKINYPLFEKCITKGKSFVIEKRYIRKDGTEIWVNNSVSPELDEQGKTRFITSVTIDISERKRTEEALRESEERLRAMFEQASVGIVQVTIDGQLVMPNAGFCKIIDYTDDEIRNLNLRDITHPEDYVKEVELTRQLFAGKIPEFIIEKRYIRKDGSIIWGQMTTTLIRRGTEEPLYALAIVEHISERKQTQEALKEADRRKDEFLATLAHELRNPLAPIRTALEIMRRDEDREKGQNAREIIERQTNQLVHLVDDLLDISRITQGKIKLRKERLNLGDPISMAVETVQPFVEGLHHSLDVRLPDAPVFVEGDRARLTQIIHNLLHNSAKYTEPGGHILLIAAHEGDEAVIRVRDNGMGIAFEMLPAIFDMFAQTVTGEKRGQGGLGIGLSLVKKLVEMHGGRVEANSEGEGKGSEFIVRLPLAADQKPEKKQEKQEIEKPRTPIKAGRILVVDDNTDAANMLEIFLSMENHEVKTAFNGREAIQAAAEFQPDTVILDIGLPDIDGYEVAKRLRERSPDICLIALSGWGQDEDRRRSNEAGFNHHLVKPVNIEELKKFLCL
jgi:two-component system CheB/CheR fusion protein